MLSRLCYIIIFYISSKFVEFNFIIFIFIVPTGNLNFNKINIWYIGRICFSRILLL